MSKPLDKLYGRGTAKGLRALVGGKIEEAATDDGVRVYFQWGDGSVMKVDAYQDRVHFLTLRSEGGGLYSELCEKLPAFFKARGVKRFTASPRDKEAEAILRKRGEWDESMSWEL